MPVGDTEDRTEGFTGLPSGGGVLGKARERTILAGPNSVQLSKSLILSHINLLSRI